MLFLGGRRELGALAVAEAAGEGVEVDIMSTAAERGDCITQVGRFIPLIDFCVTVYEGLDGWQ